MDTKNFQPSFQMIANTISSMSISNTIANISDSDDLQRTFSLRVKEIAIETHEEYKSAGLDIEVDVTIKEKEDIEPKKFELNMVISGVFVDDKVISDEELQEKLKINGVAALFSVARGCITNISSQCLSEGKIVLPLVNFMEFAKAENKD